MVSDKAQAATVFPVVSGYQLEGVRLEHLIIDGNKDENISLNGCRGGGIFLYRGFGTVLDHCTVRNYHGDGISFQQSNDVEVRSCVSEDNTGLGLHPGSGSQRPIVRECVARRNGEDGLFLCWRVRHGLFEKNILENNGRFGISIGTRIRTISGEMKSGPINRTCSGRRERRAPATAIGSITPLRTMALGSRQCIRVRGETRDLQPETTSFAIPARLKPAARPSASARRTRRRSDGRDNQIEAATRWRHDR
jgi:hypothetical protein